MLRPHLYRVISTLAAFAVVTLFTVGAHAQRELLTPLGNRGTLAIDQLSGFRVGTVGGVGFSGPIGFSTQNLSVDIPDASGRVNGSESFHYTNFWIAPSVDYFVIDHLSIGGLIEFATTSLTTTTTLNGPPQSSTSVSQPSITSVTFLPRVGWMFAITDRFGIWPRGGLGYASRSQGAFDVANANVRTTNTYSSFIFDVDVGFVYRVNENWYLRAAPEVTFGPGSVSSTNGNITTSTGAQLFQFSAVGGIGVMWDLL